MESCGIYVALDSTPAALVELFSAHLRRWRLYAGESSDLRVRISQSVAPGVVLSRGSGRPVREAAEMVSRATGIPVIRIFSGGERNIINIRVPVDEDAANNIIAMAAWSLFLWTASRYPARSAWESLMGIPESVAAQSSAPPVSAEPAEVSSPLSLASPPETLPPTPERTPIIAKVAETSSISPARMKMRTGVVFSSQIQSIQHLPHSRAVVARPAIPPPAANPRRKG